jgi:hypothetical protein
MTELELLAREIEWPATPDVAGRLVLEPRRRSRRVLVAVALALLALAVAFAVPPARSAILRFFHLGGVTVERVDTVPPAQERPLAADLGAPISRAGARLELGRPFRLPPEASGARLYGAGGVVSAVLATPEPVLLSEFGSTGLMKKLASASTSVERVEIAPGVEGLWLSGGEHVFFGPSIPPRLAGNVLLWERGGVTFRLEGRRLGLKDALRLARSLEGTSTG